MRTSRHYKHLLSIFREESDRLKRAVNAACEAETVSYYAHIHLYLCSIFAEIAEISLNEHEKQLFLKRVQECSSTMSALVGEFFVKMHEKEVE